ncbi:sulfur globule protein CV1-like [Uranotaenia lowii]|uniref:sulfur globule protein CV1-like n=1 Tax=Uranotaenia lowii TaxID=190385 RepID=UPI00247A6C30|nr:sulfur globule protein CV1-like [Uranotaenia lowii]XP_055588915.1 sulfur globule protein CV1-like [Uranotaenia lowii]
MKVLVIFSMALAAVCGQYTGFPGSWPGANGWNGDIWNQNIFNGFGSPNGSPLGWNGWNDWNGAGVSAYGAGYGPYGANAYGANPWNYGRAAPWGTPYGNYGWNYNNYVRMPNALLAKREAKE